MTGERIPFIRRDADGTIIDGTAAVGRNEDDSMTIHDWRDLDGNVLQLPPGSSFEITHDL